MWTHLPNQSQYEAERRAWLTQAHSSVRRSYVELRISSHALLLLIDMERAFCGGAWLSLIMLGQAVVESTLRQIVAEDYSTSIGQLSGKSQDLRWLRELRNEITHAGEPGTPSKLWKLPPNNLPACHAALEDEAKKAAEIAYKHAYAGAKDWADQ